ncbi:MAG: hypothetical protein K8T25_12170 [Planctomycetia bacterium]|nr:hypothetical protein [Planctomycetia bacterium]
MNEMLNPYAAPAIDAGPTVSMPRTVAEAEDIRMQHLRHEGEIRSVGLVYEILGSLLSVPAMGGLYSGGELFSEGARMIPADWQWPVLGGSVLLVGLACCAFAVGFALRRLDRRVKLPLVLLSGVGLLIFPLGTLVNGWVLYLLLSRQGGAVLSPQYAEVCRMTPKMRYRGWTNFDRLLAATAAVGVIAGIAAAVGWMAWYG